MSVTFSVPMTGAQQAIWMGHQLDAQSAAFNIASYVKLPTRFDPALLQRAFDQAISETEALRIRVREQDDQAELLVLEHVAVELAGRTFDCAAKAQQWMSGDLALRTDLINGPVFTSALLSLATGEDLWYFKSHHIALDGVGLSLFMQRVAQLYGQPVSADHVPVFGALSRIVESEQAWLESPEHEASRRFWHERCAHQPEVASLSDSVSVVGQQAIQHLMPLNESTFEQLQRMAHDLDSHWVCVLLAGFAAFMGRSSGHRDVVIGVPMMNRASAAATNVPCTLANVLPLSLEVDPWADVAALVAKVDEELAAIRPHQRYRAEDIRRDCGLLGEGRRLTGPQINIDIFTHPLHFGPDTGTTHVLSAGPADDFSLLINRGPDDGLQVLGMANPLAYSAEELRGHVERFCRFMAEFTLSAKTPLGQLQAFEALPVSAVQGTPGADQPVHDTLVSRFEYWARHTPDALALTLDDVSFSYRELDLRASQLARLIVAQSGAVAGLRSPVALLLERSLNTVVAILAVLKTGAAYVPLDPDAPTDRLENILADTRPDLLICDGSTLAFATQLRQPTPLLSLADPEVQARLQTVDLSVRLTAPAPQDLAYIIYTSGSTGKPKGVCIEHRQVVRLFTSTHSWFDYRPSDAWTGCHAYIFDASVWEMWGALFNGGRLVLVPVAVTRDPQALLELVVREQITVFGQIPSAFYRFMEAEHDRPDLVARMQLRYQCFGGEALDLTRLASWFELERSQETRLLNLYGITETTVNATYQFITPQLVNANSGSLIGTVYADLDIQVLDDALKPVQPGAYGEMYVRGAGLARGYLNRPELDATRFVADPFGAPGERMYRSGDVAILLEDGSLEYVGRADQQVKLRGYRIELGEIESHLRGHEWLSDAVALVTQDQVGDPRLVAHVVPAPGVTLAQVAPEVLRDYLRDRVPPYMVPNAIGVLASLPISPTGKVDRRALPQIEVSSERELTPPRDELDSRVLSCWAEELGDVPVSIDDSFFDVGGDSIKAIRICRDLDIPVMHLFDHPTPRDCADYLREHQAGQAQDASMWLQKLDRNTSGQKLNLICVPFAGGNAFAYRNLAEHLVQDFACVSAVLPGHDVLRTDEPMQDIETVSQAVVQQALETLNGPIVVYGHCAGNALAISIARGLEQAGADLRALVVGGMLLDENPEEVVANVAGQSGQDIIAFLQQLGGFKDVPDQASLDAIATMTQHDANQTAGFFAREALDRQRLRAPIHVIVGSDDPLTADYERRYLDWHAYSDDVQLSVVEGGGHYFVTDLAAPLAQVLRAQYGQIVAQPRGRAPRSLRAFYNPFDAQHGQFLLLANERGQHSLWPTFAATPAGWHTVSGPASHQQCLDTLATHGVPALEGLDAPGWPSAFATLYREQGLWTGETLGEILTRHVEQRPQAIAISQDDRALSYAQLDAQANRLADGFAGLGIRAGDRVAVQLPNCIEFVETIFALFRLGAIPVFALPSDRLHEITHILSTSGASAYVIQDQATGFDYRAIARQVLAQHAPLKHVIVLGDAQEFVPLASLYGQPHRRAPRNASEPALITLSGGSTALPKLILRRHDDYLYSIRASAEICQLDERSAYLCVLPAGHNFTLSSPGFLGVLYAGGRVVMQAEPSGSSAFAAIERERITFTSLVPSLAQAWLHAPQRHDISSLEYIQVGGARLADDVAKRLSGALGCGLQQVYGMSEGLVCYTALDDTPERAFQTQGRPISAHDEIRIVDEDDQPVAPGESGHLLVRGPYTIRGYLNAPQHNAVAFTRDGFYRTGDVVMQRPDGYLVVTGRIKDQVNRGAEKIAAEEVEGHLMAHPGVLEAAIVGLQDEFLGEASCAVIVAVPGVTLTAQALKQFIRDRNVAAFKVPDHIRLVPSLPKTTLGKIDKKQLRLQLTR